MWLASMTSASPAPGVKMPMLPEDSETAAPVTDTLRDSAAPPGASRDNAPRVARVAPLSTLTPPPLAVPGSDRCAMRSAWSDTARNAAPPGLLEVRPILLTIGAADSGMDFAADIDMSVAPGCRSMELFATKTIWSAD